ncbi:hypothetical protein [Roseibium algae]|uniref:YARHG domain-containing protein n=1 Tax=Roseibium algae TaxID=3123038 RepID=A0ABU8TRB7_9HYPH
MMKTRSHFVLIANLVSALACSSAAVAQNTPELAAAMRMPTDRFETLSCQKLWYLEHKVLAAGRVCLPTERARAAFSSAKHCISKNERILAAPVQAYLTKLRNVAGAKNCTS